MLVRKEGGQWTASMNRSSSVLIFVNGTSGKNRIIKYYKNSLIFEKRNLKRSFFTYCAIHIVCIVVKLN